MAHKLLPFYNDFGGMDTRSNKLSQPPNTYRDGSKNFRHTMNDELARRYGFHHKTNLGAGCELALMEYKYKDINTGQSLTKILGVSDAGVLSKLDKHRLKISVTAASTVYYYSFYYDSTQYTLKFYDSAQAVLGTVNITLTTTLDSLNTSINALAITGLTASTVDADGTVVTSSEYAYHLDVVYMEKFNKTVTDTQYNDLYYWTEVTTPDGSSAFPTSVTYKDDPNWEGISYVNLNNAIYITDGGFPMKYDGYSVYRAGMPRTLGAETNIGTGPDGFVLTSANGSGTLDTGAIYKYKFQYCFKDANGNEICGKILNPLYIDLGAADDTVDIAVPPIRRATNFPVYACQVNGAQDLNSGALTFNVQSGHNIKAGMTLRIPITNTVLGFPGYSNMYCLVSSVTATTITLTAVPLNNADHAFSGSTTLINNQWINAGYCPSTYNNKTSDVVAVGTSYFLPDIFCGAYVKVFRTRGGEETYYHLIDLAVPYVDGSASKWTFTDIYPDTGSGLNLSTVTLDETSGEELPRACKYLGKWQEQFVQAGRPYGASSIIGTNYPTAYTAAPTNSWGLASTQFEPWVYGENDICDFQSIYWADTSNIEGFPQSGANEESFESTFNDQITGFIENKNALLVFKDRTTAYITGTLATGDLVKEFIEADIGSINMNCIQNVRGFTVFCDKFTGFWAMVPGRLPEHIGWPISDLFLNNEQNSRDNYLRLKRAVACNYKNDNQYICYIPAGKKQSDETGVIADATTGSKFFVFDYAEKAKGYRAKWDIWQGVDASGGILATANDELLLAQKSSTDSRLWKQKRSFSKYDYSDHTSAIEWNVKLAFQNSKAPMIDKNFHKVWLSSIFGGFSVIIQQYANYIDTVLSSYTLTFLSSSSTKKSPKNYANLNVDKLSAMSVGLYNNTVNEDIRIEGIEIEYSTEYDSGEGKQ